MTSGPGTPGAPGSTGGTAEGSETNSEPGGSTNSGHQPGPAGLVHTCTCYEAHNIMI